MTQISLHQPSALVVAASADRVAPRIASLRNAGFSVRFFDNASDALTLFGEDIPEIAVIDRLPATPCRQLLLEDLEQYGVSTVMPPPLRARTRPDGAGLQKTASGRERLTRNHAITR